MCTVTYVPTSTGCILTSNRDENPNRPAALTPQLYAYNEVNLLYPKDALAGGSWLAVHSNGNVAILLNGAFVHHDSNPPYTKSRGLVLLDIISNAHPIDAFLGMNLTNIEPFTIVLYQQGKLYETRWDGAEKHHKGLPTDTPQIWSSATLYTPEVVQKRKNWFADWLKHNHQPTQEALLDFHHFAGNGRPEHNLLMYRDGRETVSITSIAISAHQAKIVYNDLLANAESHFELPFEPASL